jgi:hypothetical protein
MVAELDRRHDDGAGELDGDVGVERALDIEVVVADPKHQVDDFNRALGAVDRERAVHELDGAKANTTGEDHRLAERLGVAGREVRSKI